MAEKIWKEVKPESDVHDFDTEAILEGEYVELEKDVGSNKSNMYSIKKSDGEVAKAWGCVTLDARMESVDIGEQVQIELHNKVPNRYGNLTKIFKVRILEK